MRELIEQLLAAHQSGRDLIYCRLVETRGSTPQKAGALMLLFADGSQAGTLGGGCVEADVKRQALALLPTGKPEILSFQLDNDYGWDDGLICGGRMQILVEPVRAADDVSYFESLRNALTTGGGTEAIAFDASKASLPATACVLFNSAEEVVASRRLPPNAKEALSTAVAELRSVTTRPRPYHAHGVAYLPLLEHCRLLIVGGGHVGQALGHLAADLDFDVWVLDDREEYVTEERFPRAEQRICGPIGPTLKNLAITPDTYAVIVTRGHHHDEEALFHLADRGARYVGMIGSKRKIKLIFDDLLAAGISSESLARVYAPLGIDIGSQTVPEIAVSIAAELVAHRNRGLVPSRPDGVLLTAHES